MEKIKGLDEFLKVDSHDGSGNSCGYGFATGEGMGNGAGEGWGSTCGYGFGFNSSSGYGDGSGYGFGDGYGCGRYDESGFGYGCSDDVSVFNHNKVYKIDYIPTIIKLIKGNVAKGFILNNDFTLDECFIVKDGNLFAHGKTLREAIEALNEKKWEDLDINEVIAEFCNHFEKEKSYKGSEFFKWHHYLTGSCLQGRENFVKNHNLSLDDEFTVDEFIKLTEKDYGGKIIKQLKEVWEGNRE